MADDVASSGGRPKIERRLAAILAADVAGYSRLTGLDEEGTLASLKARRRALIDPKIAEHRGRIVKTTGDGMLLTFDSVIDALRCAIETQQGMISRNADLPEDRRIRFRIGINVGDVIVDGADIHGDGVNLAARLEALAEPGGILVSRVVRDQILESTGVTFDDLGEQKVKNIARPIHVFRARPQSKTRPESAQAPMSLLRRRRLAWAAVAAAVALSVALWFGWRADWSGSTSVSQGRPSIAVLPFANLSDDKEQDYFSDGLTEDVLTELARLPRLLVLSRNATAKYKGQAVDIVKVGRELNARFVLEGSVRRSGDQVRVTGQLIETASGSHVWAERYDRPLREIFAVQDELTRAIAQKLFVAVQHQDTERAKRKPPESLDAYDLFLRGREQFLRFSQETDARALALFEQSVARDPNYADAIGFMARIYARWAALRWGPLPANEAQEKARQTAQRALGIDATSPQASMALSLVYLFQHRADDAAAVLERSVQAYPGMDELLARLGDAYTYGGKPDRGVELLRQAERLNPQSFGNNYAFLGRGLLLLNRHAEAIEALQTCALLAPRYRPCHEIATVAYAEIDRLDEARAALARARAADPQFSLASVSAVLPFKRPEDLDRFVEGLRRAGLTD